MEYIPGQRWISEAEPELGLGTILRCDGRALQVLYAKSGTVRNYATHGAPLARATFRVGQRITGKGISFVVERIDLRDGLLVYSGERRELAEGQLDDEQAVSRADARLISGRVDKPHLYELRKRALTGRAAARRSPAWGILSARIELLPHQLGVLAACMEREHPRVLLADEAGLGKTIEASMLIARMLATGRAARVLVLLPEALVVQWFVELRRRFQLAFAIVDEERCRAITEADPARNPFEDDQLTLASLAWLAHDPKRQAQALAAGWDLLVVDEAHHLEWTPDTASAEYLAAEALARATPAVALLTATPEQLGRRAHFARLRLLDPARFEDLDRYLADARNYASLSSIAARIDAGERLDAAGRAALVARFPHDPALQALIDGYPGTRRALLTALIDRHGTGRVMYRNRRDAVGGFPGRVLEVGPAVALEAGVRARLLREFDADIDGGGADGAPPDYAADPRIAWLTALLDAHPDERLLLIATTRAKVEAIDTALRTRTGARVACFHEGLTLAQRDRAASWFAEAGGARLLLCSEIGSEGRNFQFAHRLALWDLPLDPDLLEQRIGRLDRIGQRRPVVLHVPGLPGTAQEALLRWHADGTRVLRECPADGRELLRQFGDAAVRVARTHAQTGEAGDPELDALVAATAAAHAELSVSIRAGRDRMLELAARHADGDTLLAALRAADADGARHELIQECFEAFGVHAEDLDDGSVLLDPEFLATDALPGFADGRRAVTFDRTQALAREELDLLRMDHPLAVGAFDLLLSGETGNAAFLVDTLLPPRSVLLEGVYVIECVADARLDTSRFLPATALSVCVDSRLQSRDYVPSPTALLRARERAPEAVHFRRHFAQLVPPMLERTDQLAAERAQATITAAIADARRTLALRIERLRALAIAHASVRADEITAAEATRDAIAAALARARPRLDAVRIAVSPDFLTLR